MIKGKYELKVIITLPEGMVVDKDYKQLKEDCRNTKVPDGGFLNKDVDVEEIKRLKICKSTYRRITDLYEIAKRQGYKIIEKEAFYNQMGYPYNYVIYTLNFKTLDDKIFFSQIFFRCHPECVN